MQQNRAIALYRCSTDRQDLSDQKESVRNFISKNNLQLIDEYEEDGVSGYKSTLAERPVILEILFRAEKADFDKLIIFMFDRLGRDETIVPYIIQQLKKFNVSVYTSQDGNMIHAEKHEDKLINYFNSWASEYESIKTSLRIKNTFLNKNNHGEWTGGNPPFGYEIFNTGVVKQNGKIEYGMKICERESEIVKLIFDLCIQKNFGAGRISAYLNQNGYENRLKTEKNKEGINEYKAVPFRSNSILRIIKNTIYIGKQHWNVTTSTKNKIIRNNRNEWKTKPINSEWIIIDEDTFYKANQLLKTRNPKQDDNTEINFSTKSKLLCSGLAYCHCGKKLKTDYSMKKYYRKDGTVTKIYTTRYKCPAGLIDNHFNQSTTSYAGKKYDKKVEELIINYINTIDSKILEDEIQKYNQVNIERKKAEVITLNSEKNQCYILIQKYEKQMDSCVLNDDFESMKYFKNGIVRQEDRIKEINEIVTKLGNEIIESSHELNDISQTYNNLKDWSYKFQNQDLDSKKSMLMQVVDKIIFQKDKIIVDMKISLKNSIKNCGSENTPIPSGMGLNIYNKFRIELKIA
jgi:DNA invertase Pin-like site-specific DNA recombinase